MKKCMLTVLSFSLLLSSCSLYTASTATTGAEVGHIMGSGIGDLVGGRHGRDIGSLIGTMGGLAAGAAIGSAIDPTARQRRMQADDRIDFDESVVEPSSSGEWALEQVEIRHPRLRGLQAGEVLRRGEECQVTFDVINTGQHTVYDVLPMVACANGNRHLHISPDVTISALSPQEGVRYTATIKADRGLKDGRAIISVGIGSRKNQQPVKHRTLTLNTRKR